MRFSYKIIHAILLFAIFAGAVSAQEHRRYYIDPAQTSITEDENTGYYYGDLPAIAEHLVAWYGSGDFGNKTAQIIISPDLVPGNLTIPIVDLSPGALYPAPLSETREIIFKTIGYSENKPQLLIDAYPDAINWWNNNKIVFENCLVDIDYINAQDYVSFYFTDCTISQNGNISFKNTMNVQHSTFNINTSNSINLRSNNACLNFQDNQISGNLRIINQENISDSEISISSNDILGSVKVFLYAHSTEFSFIGNRLDTNNEYYGLDIIGLPHILNIENNEFYGGPVDGFINFEDTEYDPVISADIIITDENSNLFGANNAGRESLLFSTDASNSSVFTRSIVLEKLKLLSPIVIEEGGTPVFVLNSEVNSSTFDNFIPAIYNDLYTQTTKRNRKIIPPIISSVSTSYNDLTEVYNLNLQLTIDQPLFENDYYALTADNAPFVVEVYRSNYKGDLLERIAVEQYSFSQYNTLQTLNINALENLPQWIAVTLSAGIDTQGNTSEDPIGTSEPLCIPVNPGFDYEPVVCTDESFSFSMINSPYFSYTGRISELSNTVTAPGASVAPDGTYSYSTPGDYLITVQVNWVDPNNVNHILYDQDIPVTVVGQDICDQLETCLTGFSPTPGKYLLSAWVKEEVSSLSYENAAIKIQFLTSSDVLVEEQGRFMPRE